MAKNFNIKKGGKVAFNLLDDAVWYTVIEIDGLILEIQEVDTNYAHQFMDKSLVKQFINP